MAKKCLLALLLLIACLCFPARCPAEAEGKRRALLIGSDHFVTQPDTFPAAGHNLEMLADAIASDTRGYASIRSCCDEVKSREDLEALLSEAFGESGENDTSLLYIGTHGIQEEGKSNLDAALLLSDGQQEYTLTARTLAELIKAIPGRKIVILDACGSGAFLGKGMADVLAENPFQGSDCKVICSAGGSEASWLWQGAQNGGASYFATVLSDALGLNGDHAADENADGLMTLQEVYHSIRDNYAASTPQVYPENDSETVVFAYDPTLETRPHKALTGLTFDETLLPSGEEEVRFSFTMQRTALLFYQLIYHQDGAWQFADAQQFLDAEQWTGTTSAGRKTRTLYMDTGSMQNYGYAMVQFITMEKGKPVLQGARLLCVEPRYGEVRLSVSVTPAFTPALGQEANIIAWHDVPCGLTVRILDAEKETVRRLCYASPSRPQQLSPSGSTFYWDGRDDSGSLCLPGAYTVSVRVKCGRETFTAESVPFTLMDPAP